MLLKLTEEKKYSDTSEGIPKIGPSRKLKIERVAKAMAEAQAEPENWQSYIPPAIDALKNIGEIDE